MRIHLTFDAPTRPAQALQTGSRSEAEMPAEVVVGLSGHSARVGAAQDMVAAGIELPAILQAGRWKSTEMVRRYGERLLARRSAAGELARLQRPA